MPGNVLAVAGLLLGSITPMHVMDRGSQPTLGIAYRTLNYAFVCFAAPGRLDDPANGFVNWIAATVAAAYTARLVKRHWRDWYGLVPGTAPSRPNLPTPSRNP
jgi:hypothetical protein